MYKIIGVVALVAFGYFMFFNSSYPDKISFQGNVLSNKQDNNNSLNKEIDVFSYSDASRHHNMMFAILNDSEITVARTLHQYKGRFKHQGFRFTNEGNRYLGKRNDERLYISSLKNLRGIVAYIAKADADSPDFIADADMLFLDLESYRF